MKSLLGIISIFAILACTSVMAKADKELARKQLIQASKSFSIKNNIPSIRVNKAMQKIGSMSAMRLQNTINEMQGKGISLGENSQDVVNQLDRLFKSYTEQNNKGYQGGGYMRNTLSNGHAGNGTTNALKNSIRPNVQGSRTSQQSDSTDGGFVRWVGNLLGFYDPDKAYEKDYGTPTSTGLSNRNAPKGCLTIGCAETDNPSHESSAGGDDPLSRQKNIARINAKNGQFGFKGDKKDSSITIDPKTGKAVKNRSIVTKRDKFGNPVRVANKKTITEQQKLELELKAKGGKVK